MEINSIGQTSFFPNVNILRGKEPVQGQTEIKTQASALDASGSYSKAYVVMQQGIQKAIFMSDLSVGEVRRLGRSISASAEEISDDLYDNIEDFDFTKDNILLMKEIISDESLYSNPILIDNLDNFVTDVTNPFQSNLYEQVFGNDALLHNKDFISHAGDVISAVNSAEQYEFAYRVLSDERLFSNKNLAEKMKDTIKGINSKETLYLKNKIVDRILNDKNLLNNTNIASSLGFILAGVNNSNGYEIADKILSDEKLYDNKNVADKLYFIIDYSSDDNRYPVTDAVLSDEKIYNNEAVMNCLYSVLMNVRNPENSDIAKKLFQNFENYSYSENSFKNLTGIIPSVTSELQYTVADRILSDKNLYADDNVARNASGIIMQINDAFGNDIADKIFSSENLYGNEQLMNAGSSLISSVNSADKAYIAGKILDNPELLSKEYIVSGIAGIINSVNNPVACKFAEGILSDNKYYENPDFMKKLPVLTSEISNEDKLVCAQKFIENEELFNDEKFTENYAGIMTQVRDKAGSDALIKNIDRVSSGEMLPSQFFKIYEKNSTFSGDDFITLNNAFGKNNVANLSDNDISIAVKYIDFKGAEDLNELSRSQKREFVKALVSSDTELNSVSDELRKELPLLPSCSSEYSNLIKNAVISSGVEVKPLNQTQKNDFLSNINSLSSSLARMSDEEFDSLVFKQEYDKNEFISDVLEITDNLESKERQKVYDYFGFELQRNENASFKTDKYGGISLTGYPISSDNTSKLEAIKSDETLSVIEKLRPFVVKFSENNKISSGNEKIDNEINAVIEALPELRPTIGRMQHCLQSFDVFKHSMNVARKISQDAGFENLNPSDKKVILIAAFLHDITKKEGAVDREHSNNSAVDTFFIAKKFDLTSEEEVKLNNLIKNHEWLGIVNTSISEEELETRIQKTAYEFVSGNTFYMSLMFTHADLKAVSNDDSFHDSTEGQGRTDFNGNVRSFGESADYYAQKIREKITELQQNQPFFPVTQFPKASTVDKAITCVKEDGSTNIKGVYKDKDNLTYIKFNEVEDWEAIGFPKGSISKGIQTLTERNESVDTGNVHFFVHALDNESQLAKFDVFSLPDSDALLSLSYAERPESKYGFFKPQGILLDCEISNVHGGGGPNNMGTGLKKNLQDFISDYFSGGQSKNDRAWVSRQIKGSLGMSDEEYVKFVDENKNKPFSFIIPESVRNRIIETFSSMNSNPVCGNRAYNEIFASEVKPPMAVFSSSGSGGGHIGNPVEFFGRENQGDFNFGFSMPKSSSPLERTEFLKQYALENDLTFVVFGD